MKKNVKSELGWLSDRGHEKLDRVLDAYFQAKCKEKERQLPETRLKRILRHQLSSALARDTGIYRITIDKIISKEKKDRVKIKTIGDFFDKLSEFFERDYNQNNVNPSDLIFDEYKDVEIDNFIESNAGHSKVSSKEWQKLLKLLQSFELQDTIAACQQAFLISMGSDVRSHRPKLDDLKTLQDVKQILSDEDDPQIAVEFANALIDRCNNALIDRCNIKTVKEKVIEKMIQWRDRLAQQYNITVTAPEPAGSQQSISAYLLITLKPSGSGKVLLGASLKLEGDISESEPIDISDADKWISCFDEVPEHLPARLTALIGLAEQKLLARKVYEKLTLEVFLPYNYLDYRVDELKIQDEFGQTTTLGRQYAVAVRSLDRSQNTTLSLQLGNRYNFLQEVIRNQKIREYFYPAENSKSDSNIDYKNFNLELEKYIGLKWPHQLPEDKDDRLKLFQCILKSGIPVVTWVFVSKEEPQETLKAFDHLLTVENLSNFYNFGQEIKKARCTPQHPLQHIGLLWDCPHRKPPLPVPLKTPQ